MYLHISIKPFKLDISSHTKQYLRMMAAINKCSKNFSESTKLCVRNVLTVKLILLGVNSFGVWAVSLTWAGGEGGGGGLGVQAWTVTSVDLWCSELRALSSLLRPKGSSEEWCAG